jgi:hypothetical protein
MIRIDLLREEGPAYGNSGAFLGAQGGAFFLLGDNFFL